MALGRPHAGFTHNLWAPTEVCISAEQARVLTMEGHGAHEGGRVFAGVV